MMKDVTEGKDSIKDSTKHILKDKMIDFIKADIYSDLSDEDIFQIFVESLPHFIWKKGDSESQGSYITGKNSAKARIQCWTEEEPIALSLSLRSSTMEKYEAFDLIELIVLQILPSIGKIIKINI